MLDDILYYLSKADTYMIIRLYVPEELRNTIIAMAIWG